jgi:hypothetical protein
MAFLNRDELKSLVEFIANETDVLRAAPDGPPAT